MYRFKSLVEIFLILLSTSAHANSSKVVQEHSPAEFLSHMSLDEKIGQLFLFGFYGTTMTGDLHSTIKNYHPGGIIFFSRNILSASQVGNLNFQIQTLSLKTSHVPVFTAVDQEGGVVTRIKNSPPLPSALAVGQTQSLPAAENIGYLSGKILKSLGFNLNLAPVLDIADPKAKSFIGTRSFSENPDSVGPITAAYSEGLMRAGVLATLKHFPGHGGDIVDPHNDTPEINDPLSKLFSFNLKPYKYLISHLKVPLIMVAHVAVPSVDSKATVATYSKVLLDGVLRRQLGYTGLIITDDIDMTAAKLEGGPSTQAVEAIKAGADIIMIAWNHKSQRAAVRGIKDAISRGELSVERINESVIRVLETKHQFELFQEPSFSMEKTQLALRDPAYGSAVKNIFQVNFSNATERKLASLPTKKTIVFSRSHNFLRSFARRAPTQCCRAFMLESANGLTELLERNKTALAVIHVSGELTARIVNSVPAHMRNRILLVNTNSPSLILPPENYTKIINLYSYYPEAGSLVANYLFSNYVIGSTQRPFDLTPPAE